MDQKEIVKKSFIIFLIGEVIMAVSAMIFHQFNLLSGFLLGYIVSVIVYFMTVKMTDAILLIKGNGMIIAFVMFLLKMSLVALSFYLSIIFDQFLNLAGTFLGFFVMKVTLILYYRKEVVEK